MNRFLILIAGLLLTATQALAQADIIDGKLGGVLPIENGQVVYSQTYSTPELAKEEVFRRARRWWVYTYTSAKDALQVSDDKAGELIGKGRTTVKSTGKRRDDDINVYMYYTLSFQVTGEGYSVRVSDLNVTTNPFAEYVPFTVYKASEKKLPRVLTAADQHVKTLLYSLNTYILSEKQ